MKYESFRRHLWAVPFEIIMLAGVFVTFAKHDYFHLLTALFTFTVSFAPLIFERLFKVRLPSLLQVSYVAFVFGTMFVGEVWGVYAKLPWWDDVAHFLSGLLVGIGVILWLSLLEYKKKLPKLPGWLLATFTACFMAAIAVLWEACEFSSDQIFGTFSQGADLVDTMWDIILGSSGGVVMGILFLFYSHGKRVAGVSKAVEEFQRFNR
jgi:Mn2+/Fe2+ NRAMP family transporter